jgi:hypothetical protein
MRRLPPAALLLAALACRAAMVDVAVTFDNTWRVRGRTLTAAEQTRIKAIAFATLQQAFDRFNVRFTEGRSADRRITIEDTP